MTDRVERIPERGKSGKRRLMELRSRRDEIPEEIFRDYGILLLKEDWDFLFGEIDRLTAETAALSSNHNREWNERRAASGLASAQRWTQSLSIANAKLREQHEADKRYIAAIKAEVRRLRALLPAGTPIEIVGVRADGCEACGCPDPAFHHPPLSHLQGALEKAKRKRLELGLRYRAVVGRMRRAEAIARNG